MKNKNKSFLCKRNYANFEIGKFYEVDLETHFLKETHLHIGGNWFTTEIGDKSFFPSLYTYFFSEKEERRIKLQIIEVQNKIGCSIFI